MQNAFNDKTTRDPKYILFLTLAVVLLLTIAFRVYRFSTWPIDIDEAFTPGESLMVNGDTFSDYFTFKNNYHVHGPSGMKLEDIQNAVVKTYPMYYFLNGMIIKKLGVNTYSIRILSVVASILSVVLIFIICKYFISSECGLIACILYIAHPITQFHAQNARFYSMVLLFSVLNMFLACVIRDRILFSKNMKYNNILLSVFASLMGISMLVHGSAVFSLVFVLVVFIDILRNVGLLEFINRTKYFFLVFLCFSFFIAYNNIMFFYSRMAINTNFIAAVGGSEARNLFHAISSMVFNFGIHYWLLIPLSIWVYIKEEGGIFRIFFISFVASLIVYTVLARFSAETRVDYIYTVIPIFLILIGMTIIRSIEILSDSNEKYKNYAKIFVSAYLVALAFPGFWSNLTVDGGRYNWTEAYEHVKSQDIRNGGKNKFVVYTSSPGNISMYGTPDEMDRVRQIRTMEIPPDERESSNIYFIIPLSRTGFDMRTLSSDRQRYIFDNSKLMKIVGKNRYDLHVYKLAILKFDNRP